MSQRYRNREVLFNRSPQFRSILKKRGLRSINQFKTGQFRYPTPDEIKNLNLKQHIWKTGDHYYKLAHKYYGDVNYWWLIAIFNKKPTEADVEYGDVIYVPTPLQKVLRVMQPQ